MTVQFALDTIPRRMRELGFEDYITRWKHIQVDPNASVRIDSYNEFHFLIEPSDRITVKSKMGAYDAGDSAINQMQYVHRGKITVTNKTPQSTMVLFIQVIPNHKK